MPETVAVTEVVGEAVIVTETLPEPDAEAAADHVGSGDVESVPELLCVFVGESLAVLRSVLDGVVNASAVFDTVNVPETVAVTEIVPDLDVLPVALAETLKLLLTKDETEDVEKTLFDSVEVSETEAATTVGVGVGETTGVSETTAVTLLVWENV